MDRTYCIFGDSVTQAAYQEKGWVDQLRLYLENKHKDGFVSVYNLGIGGNTSSDILLRIEQECTSRSPTHVIIAIGVNDSGYRQEDNQPTVKEERFKANIELIIDIVKKYTREISFVSLVIGDEQLLKPLPDGDGVCYSIERVARYNAILKRIVLEKRSYNIELSGVLEDGDFEDGLHPNKSGHGKMSEAIKKYF